MFWVYTNFFFYVSKNDFLLKNFLFLNYFNIYLIHNNNKIFKTAFTNQVKKEKNFFFFVSSNKNNFLLKYIKYFNRLVFQKGESTKFNQLNYYGFNLKNGNKYYFFSNFNYQFYKKFINLLFKIVTAGFNYLVLSKSYKNITPLYNYVFNFKNLMLYKSFFFFDSKFFSFNNFSYFYNRFYKKFSVILLIILDFSNFNKFLKIFKKSNIATASLIPINNQSNLIDFPIYLSQNYNLEKFLFLNLLTQITLIGYNYKLYKNKLNFIKIFYNFSIKLKDLN